ncbi:hypothetical protein Ciccas_002303 [Cichlidogyrus casuarinus]|uniref:K Homology domain-containing protein n=1 Tax=Cichlidogyrus casuarinus TaxID=1844966 RepID=A0ABD2QHY5_9PLAT
MQASNAKETPPQAEDTVYLHYDTAFPELHTQTASKSNGISKPARKTVKPCSFKSNNIKEFIEIPCSERASNFAGKKSNSLGQLAADLSKQHGVEVDINSSKSQSLTIVISGSPENVANAKCAVVRSLQTQSKIELHVDSKYHRFIIGRGGQTLSALERETTTKINVPSSNKTDSDIITITGPKQSCDSAKNKIMSIVDMHSKLSSERLHIPKCFHVFIKGPRRCNIIRWTEQHRVRIDMAPPSNPAEDICVSGDKQKVDIVVKEIQKIYTTHQESAKRCVINVPKNQHRLVFGPRGSGLEEILESTGVSVELPQTESDEIALFGPSLNMGAAITKVIERSASSVRDEISAPNRFHKILIGKSGAALATLLEGYQDRVKVEFGSQTNRIELEGPTEDVQTVKNRLQTRLKELENTMAIETLKVPSKYHGMIVGRDGANVRRIREKYNCQISLRQNLNETSEIVVEGDAKSISHAAEEIREFVKRLENEKMKDLIIEPDIQALLRIPQGGAPMIKGLYDEFPKVTFHWPISNDASNPVNSVCQLSGQRQDVDLCADKLIKLVKTAKESNFHHEFRVYREFRGTFFARENNKVRAILNELQCRLQTPPAGSDSSAPTSDKSSELFWIVGREKQVHQAVDRIDALQRQIMNMKEVRLPIPPFVLAKAVGNAAPRLRSIKEQCDGVSFKFPRTSPDANTSAASAKEIIIYGPSEAVAKAQKLVEELNKKVAELCDEVSSKYFLLP